ncbi:MAG: hypothetical protein ACLGHL_02545, partial [Actinomycetota bacterium]
MHELLLAAEETEKVLREGFITNYMWLVPLLPFISFWTILFFGKKLPGKGHSVGIAAAAIAFVISLVGFIDLASGAEHVEKSWTWFQFGEGEHVSLRLELGMNYDFLAGIMFVVVTL